MGAEPLPLLEDERKKHKATSGLGRHGGKPLPVVRPEAVKGDARDLAAKLVGISGRTVSRADYVKKYGPKPYDEILHQRSTIGREYGRLRAKQEPFTPDHSPWLQIPPPSLPRSPSPTEPGTRQTGSLPLCPLSSTTHSTTRDLSLFC